MAFLHGGGAASFARRPVVWMSLSVVLAGIAGCGSAQTNDDGGGKSPLDDVVIEKTPPPPPLGSGEIRGHKGTMAAIGRLSKHDEQLTKLCARGHEDAITASFCTRGNDGAPIPITDLATLKKRLGVDTASFVITQSTSLATRMVTTANPRVIFIQQAPQRKDGLLFDESFDDGYGRITVALGFARGAPLVELVAWDTKRSTYNFYLVKLDLPCEASERGCITNDLLMPEIESGWLGMSLYEDEDLKDTIFTCNTCHQPSGSSGPKILLMREQGEWLHWLGRVGAYSVSPKPGQTNEEATRDLRVPAIALTDQVTWLHSMPESYAGTPVDHLGREYPGRLEGAILRSHPEKQPMFFPDDMISKEVLASTPTQPYENVPAGASAAWDRAYEANLASVAVLPFPYHDELTADAKRLETYRNAYIEVMKKTPGAVLPDPTDLFVDAARPKIGLTTAPNLPGKDVLHRACSQCHNATVEPGSRRASFNPDRVAELSPELRRAAIDRLRLSDDDPSKMPPPLFRSLSPSAIDAAIATLVSP